MRASPAWPVLGLILCACSGERFEMAGGSGAGGSSSGGTAPTGGTAGSAGSGGSGGIGGTPAECHALRYDGDDDWVRVPDDSALDGIAPLTVEAWLKADDYPSEVQIVSHHDHAAHTGFVLLIFQSGEMQFRYQFAGQNYSVGFVPVSAGAWHHVAATYDSGTARLFVDGFEKSESNIPNGITDDFSGPLTIGRAAYSKGFYFKGLIDEVRVSKTARYAVDFQPEHSFAPDSETVVYYRFEEESGQAVLDVMGKRDGWLGLDGVEATDDPVREVVPCTH